MPDKLPAKSTAPTSLTLTPKALPGGLYLVATPVGNLGDITLRALETLQSVDIIACEDTRTSHKLLSHYDIPTRTMAYHDHNGEQARPKILAMLNEGKSIALISDAGTPMIADPGYKLVREVQAAGHSITSLPGASSLLLALTLSGLPTDCVTFLGFLPAKAGARESALLRHAHSPETLVIFVSPHKLEATLQECAHHLGNRHAALARELTKLHEEVIRAPLEELAGQATNGTITIKGEMVLVIEGAAEQESAQPQQLNDALRSALATMKVKDAAAFVAAQYSLPRREVYARALELRKTE